MAVHLGLPAPGLLPPERRWFRIWYALHTLVLLAPRPTLYLGAHHRRTRISLRYHTTLAGLSHVGRIRRRNEDSLLLAPDASLAVVADGMGGHPGGDVASRAAAEAAATELATRLERLDPTATEEDRSERTAVAMVESVMRAHEAIREAGEDDPELEGMGTTITALAVDTATGGYAIGQVGDSRAYLFRRGSLTQLTRDDTWVQERVEAGDLTVEQARRHPFGHILTQCLGLEDEPTPQLLQGVVEAGDVFLLCTDGLVGMIDDDAVASILSRLGAAFEQGALGSTAEALVAAANEAGGHDNVTVALVSVE